MINSTSAAILWSVMVFLEVKTAASRKARQDLICYRVVSLGGFRTPLTYDCQDSNPRTRTRSVDLVAKPTPASKCWKLVGVEITNTTERVRSNYLDGSLFFKWPDFRLKFPPKSSPSLRCREDEDLTLTPDLGHKNFFLFPLIQNIWHNK